VFPTPAGSMLLVPSVLVMLLTAAGVGCWLAALNIQYRDVKYVVPFLLQLWMYASPVVYSLSLVPSQYRLAYAFNPLAGAIAGFRAAVLGTGAPSPTEFGVSLGMAILVFAGGAAYFRRTERVFADVA
jgi:lipopolysaccharide transport system permease protein